MAITKVTSGMVESLDASKLTGAMPAIDGSALTGISVDQELLALKTNIALNFFLDAVNHARGVQNLSDGFVDQFEDQTGVDDPNSVQAAYNTAGDFYSPYATAAGDATPTMTSLTTPSGTVSSSGGINANQAFADNSTGGTWDNNPFVVGSWIQFSFNNGLTAKTVIEYSIQGDGDATTRSAKSWTLRASNTGAFSGEEVVLDTQSGIIYTSTSEVKSFSIGNTTSYIHYRIVFTEHGGNGIMKVGEIELIADGEKNNMTIVSESSTALISPDTAQVTLFKEDVDALTLNTNLLAWASRSKQTITSDFATDNKLDATAHGLSNNDRVMVTNTGPNNNTSSYVTGDRTSEITVSTNFSTNTTYLNNFINGNFNQNQSGSFYTNGSAQANAGKEFTFVFPTARVINEATIYQQTAASNMGVYKWQGSVDGSTGWTDIGSTWTWNTATQVLTELNGNTTEYKGYKMLGVSGNIVNVWIVEIQFKEGNNSIDLPAGLDSETVYHVVNKTTNDFEVSLTSGGSAVELTDNGTGTHSVLAVTAATLVNQSTITPYDTVNASVDISAQPSGTNMNLVVQTKNNKDVKIHGQSLQWS